MRRSWTAEAVPLASDSSIADMSPLASIETLMQSVCHEIAVIPGFRGVLMQFFRCLCAVSSSASAVFPQ